MGLGAKAEFVPRAKVMGGFGWEGHRMHLENKDIIATIQFCVNSGKGHCSNVISNCSVLTGSIGYMLAVMES